MRPAARWSTLFGIGAVLSGCSGVYFNTTFNAEKAWRQAQDLREKRLRETPDDTTRTSGEERNKLIRAMTKASKVLELWPDHPKYAPRAVFLIAQAQFQMGDFDDAALKYEEYLRYFPNGENAAMARVRRAEALYLDGKELAAREALEAVFAAAPEGEVRRDALLLSARMRIDAHSGTEGLAVYERLLAEGAFPSSEGRNELRWRAAALADSLKEWEKARTYALAANEGIVPVRLQFRNHRLAILSSYRLGRPEEGLAEVRDLQRQRPFRPFRPDLKLLEGIGVEGREDGSRDGDWPAAYRLYLETVKLGPRTAAAAEALFRIGSHLLDAEGLEDSARGAFDSAVVVAGGTEYGQRAMEYAAALRRLAELRTPDTTGADSARPHYRSFMIAELFHFRLPKPDSARLHLERIVADTLEDSLHTRRAVYALAWLEENVFGNGARADSLYRVLLARYPATDWAKRAEANLGLPPTVKTRDDSAHALFLKAEQLRLSNAGAARAAEAYRKVVAEYPASPDAAAAQFTLAFLAEQQALAKPGQEAADSTKAAYVAVRDRYPGTLQAEASEKWVSAMDALADASEAGQGSGRQESDDSGESDDTLEASGPVRKERLEAADEQDLY